MLDAEALVVLFFNLCLPLFVYPQSLHILPPTAHPHLPITLCLLAVGSVVPTYFTHLADLNLFQVGIYSFPAPLHFLLVDAELGRL